MGERFLRSLIIRGQIYTGLSPYNVVQEAVLIEGDTIAFVGSFNDAVKKVKDNNFEVLDFDNNLVTPGLIDSHCHLSVAGLYIETSIDLGKASNIDEIKDIIRSEIRKGKKWIYAYGFDEGLFGRILNRWDLDDVDQNIPIIVEHVSGHMVIANSEALRRAGITKDTLDPQGGLIEKDEKGEPTGILKDTAMDLVLKILPPPTQDQWTRGILKAQRLWISNGFTSIEDTGTFGAWENIINAYRILNERGDLKIRVRVAYAISNVSEAERAFKKVLSSKVYEDSHLRTNLIKIFYDGSGLARTALLYDDWCMNGKPMKNFKGIRVTEPSDLEKMLKLFLDNNMRVAIHAIGDRAVDEITESYKRSFDRKKVKECSLSIIHAILVSKKGLDFLSDLKICVKTQPNFIYTHGHIYASNLCEYRTKRSFPLRSLLNQEVITAGSSDAPFVGSPNAGEGLYGAVFRKPRLKDKMFDYGSEESISFPEALAMYTSLAAKAIGMEDIVGSLVPEKKADLVVWNLNTLHPTEKQVLGMKPLKVFIGGKLVFEGS